MSEADEASKLNAAMSEDEIMEYLEVLDRTAEANEVLIMALENPEYKALLTRDNEVLRDIRARIWKQFTPILVDVLN